MNANNGTPPSSTSPERSALDWPREAGLGGEFMAKVNLRLRRRRRRLVGGGSVAVFIFFFALWAVPYVRHTAAVATVAAQRRVHSLADGSVAELNARSSLWVDFRHGQRTVRLDQGEAFFSVAKDARHPFLVKTPAGVIRVTGTKFNVRVAETGMVEVTLVEGAVTMRTAAGEEDKLVPGQQLAAGPGQTQLKALSPEAVENALAWKRGRIVLDGLTLAEAADRMSRFHGHGISVAADVAGLHPGGMMALDDLQGFFSAMEATLPVQVLPAADGSFRVVGRGSR
ncbi:MAG TPA: FecR domain-containing protein [Opitutaceae bacterium]|nr:FecR domain-containing protein [Opitutaceae bacterium]